MNILDIEKQYQAWIERMKIPPRVQRDPMDLDYPQLLIESEDRPTLLESYQQQQQQQQQLQHSPGPYLDINLARNIDREQFERMTLEHFLLCDLRRWKPDQSHHKAVDVMNSNTNVNNEQRDQITPMVNIRSKR